MTGILKKFPKTQKKEKKNVILPKHRGAEKKSFVRIYRIFAKTIDKYLKMV